MRIKSIVAIGLLFLLLSCNLENDPSNNLIENEYSKVASLINSDLDLAESSALQLVSKFNSVNDKFGIARFSYLLGIIYQIKAKYTSSIDYLLNSNTLFEEIGEKQYSSKCLGALGFVNNELHNYNLAIKYFKNALEVNTNNEANAREIRINLAQALLKSGKRDSAFICLKDLLITNSKEDKIIKGTKYNYVGYFYILDEDFDKAITYLQLSIPLNRSKENLAYCYNNLAYCFLMKNELDKATALVNKSLEFDVNQLKSHAFRTRAFINVKRKNLQSASSDLSSSLKYNPDLGVAAEGYKLIADIYKENGKTELYSHYLELAYNAVDEKIKLEAERSQLASIVSDKILQHQKIVLQASLSQESKLKFISWNLTGVITILLGLIGFMTNRKYKKSKRKNREIKNSIVNDFKEFEIEKEKIEKDI